MITYLKSDASAIEALRARLNKLEVFSIEKRCLHAVLALESVNLKAQKKSNHIQSLK